MSLIIEKKDKVGYLTINRPQVLNALDNETLKDLWRGWVDFGDDPDVWVVLITGAGEKAFSVGRDLKKYKAGQGTPQMAHIFESFHEFTIGHTVKMHKPVIAAIKGYALGWGFTLVLLADLRIASEDAAFGFPEVKYGLPTGIGSLLLPQTASWCHAMEILLTGERIDAREAYRMGLVNRVLPKEEVLSHAESMAKKICANAPLAVKATKRIARLGLETPFESARQSVEMMRFILRQSEDAKEGPAAFVEHRKPLYKGR